MPYNDTAWKLICKDMAYSLHQFDSWEQVPKHVQQQYIQKTIKDSNAD